MLSVLLRARAHLARREFDPARCLLEGAIAKDPKDPVLHLALSRVFLQEGRDLQAAERTLRDVLELDPENAEAKNNLAVLLNHQGRPPRAG